MMSWSLFSSYLISSFYVKTPCFSILLQYSICYDIWHQASRPRSIEKFRWAVAIWTSTIIQMHETLLKICLTINALFQEGLCYTNMLICKVARLTFVWETGCVWDVELCQHFLEWTPKFWATITCNSNGYSLFKNYFPCYCCYLFQRCCLP